MKTTLLVIGKTEEKWLIEGIEVYLNRLKHYTSFELKVVPELKNTKSLSQAQQKKAEADILLKQIKNTDYVLLLDEHGKTYSSVGFSKFIDKLQINSTSSMVLIVGGPYGFDESLHQRANGKISLSEMTFSHQMVRLIFVEQLYRAYTILKGEPYHHE
jgi:23S rRNA (pseudouridine1915-N3)-methyltransferase